MVSAIKKSSVWTKPEARDCTWAVVRSFTRDVMVFVPVIGRLTCFVDSCNFLASPVVIKFA